MKTRIGGAVSGAIALAPLTLIAQAALAQQAGTLLVTRDPGGAGGAFNLSSHVSPAGMAVLLGVAQPPATNATLVLDKGQPARWSTASPDAIDRELGGDGAYEIVVFPAGEGGLPAGNQPVDVFGDPQPNPDPVPRPDAQDAPPPRPALRADALALAPSGEAEPAPASAGPRIQPRDGTWAGAIGDTSVEGCPGSIGDMAESVLANQQREFPSRQVSFGKPFDPSEFDQLFGRAHIWIEMGANAWTADTIGDAQISIVVESPERIRQVVVSRVELPQPLIDAMGGGDECRVIGDSYWNRVSD